MGREVSAEEILKLLDGFAGFAALVNGLVLWPVVKSLKSEQGELRQLVERALKRKPAKPRKTK
jgi:hypothetical protein